MRLRAVPCLVLHGANVVISGSTTYPQSSYYQQNANNAYTQPTLPQISNPYAPPPQGGYGNYNNQSRWGSNGYDPEMESQIAQWQSAYASKEDSNQTAKASGQPVGNSNPNNTTQPSRGTATGGLSNQEVSSIKPDSKTAAAVSGSDGKQKTVVRSGGGDTWQDSSLLEWDPTHFRLFVGNLAGEVTDESLLKAFSKYTSVEKSRVIRDKRTTKSKGYGFVSFSDGDDFFQAAREMQGKYIGSHPVVLKKSTTEIKPSNPNDHRRGKGRGGKGGGGGGGHSSNTGAGVQKKQSKRQGGLKVLG